MRDTFADGLELWAVSMALDLHLAVVLHDTIWSLCSDNFDYGDCVLMITDNGVLLCDWVQDEDNSVDTSTETVHTELDFPEAVVLPSGSVGHPHTTERPRLSQSEAKRICQANESSPEDSDLEEVIIEPL